MERTGLTTAILLQKNSCVTCSYPFLYLSLPVSYCTHISMQTSHCALSTISHTLFFLPAESCLLFSLSSQSLSLLLVPRSFDSPLSPLYSHSVFLPWASTVSDRVLLYPCSSVLAQLPLIRSMLELEWIICLAYLELLGVVHWLNLCQPVISSDLKL